MSSRDSTPDDDNMRAMREAMAQSSPPKRTHSAMTGNEDPSSEHTASGTASGIRTNQNIVSAARQYAERKRLRGDQVTALEVFLNEPPSLREAKMVADLWAFGNQVDKIVTSKPAFEVSEDCETNICKYAPTVLLSRKINVYKGDGITQILTDIIKRHRFDQEGGQVQTLVL
ncbi:hypothetical protein B0H14DRAFT_3432683 [Mycena olivaceomarginata]|nr:hypothetical protein B0H14DRAFT_3432683 [Mycena olivaceomarginata]